MKTGYIYGWHAVLAVLQQAPERALTLYMLKERHDERAEQVTILAEQSGISIARTSDFKLERLAGSAQHQGVVLKARYAPVGSISDFKEVMLNNNDETKRQLILALDGIYDPHNMGAVLRVADAIGVDAVVFAKKGGCDITAAVCKVSSGATESIKLFAGNTLAPFLRACRESFWPVYGSIITDQAQFLPEIQFKDTKSVIVLGNEATGLQDSTKNYIDIAVKIPMNGYVASLNVSTAAAMLLYAWRYSS